jgi:isopentenyl diphosphate isomerase/L-lactate dehydrogenase-like FMN-dependent dehydrogenase
VCYTAANSDYAVMKRDQKWTKSLNRRMAFQRLAAFLAGSPLLRGQQDPFRDHSRIPALQELKTAFDFEPVLYAKVPRSAYDYTAYGTDGEFTLRRNREAFTWVELLPNRAAGVTGIETSTEIFGAKMNFPVLISPSAGHSALHPDGELATYQGAVAASNTTYIVSHVSSFPFEKIAASAKGTLWFQLYPRLEPDDNREVLERVQAAGAKAVVVTIDQQADVHERALHDRHLGASRGAPPRRTPPKNPYRVAENRLFYQWRIFDQIRPMVKVPLLAKGVLTAEDARLCLEHGLDGVYVSNHGGRSLDYSPATLEVLPEIVDAVGSKVPILFDSGVRRGADALKALALGAKAVCLGRLPRWGLGAYGAPGVQRILEILQAELVRAMAYTGRSSIASINRTLVRTDFP